MSEAIVDVFRSLKLRDCGRPLPASVVAILAQALNGPKAARGVTPARSHNRAR